MMTTRTILGRKITPEVNVQKPVSKGCILLRSTSVTSWKSLEEIRQWANGHRTEIKNGCLYVYDYQITNYDDVKDKHGRPIKADGKCTLIYHFEGQQTLVDEET